MTRHWFQILRTGLPPTLLVAVLSWLPAAAFGVSIEIGSARAAPGDQVRIVGVLHADGLQVVGEQVEFSFPAWAAVPARASGRPQCESLCRSDYTAPEWMTADEAGGAAKTCAGIVFAFLPAGCTPGSDCTGVRHLELALDSLEPFPDPAYMFFCTLTVAPDAPLGVSPLACANPGAANEQAERLETTCTDGALEVLCPGDCDGDAQVTVSELVTGIRIMQGEVAADECASSDVDGDGVTAVTDLVRARNTLLDGCRH